MVKRGRGKKMSSCWAKFLVICWKKNGINEMECKNFFILFLWSLSLSDPSPPPRVQLILLCSSSIALVHFVIIKGQF